MEPKFKILVIDDDYEMREALTTLLERNGYELDSARTAAEALVKLRVGHYNLVITDIVMPPVSGLLLIRMMRPVIPDFIVITGKDFPESRDEARSLGARGYFVKPFDVTELLQLVNTITAKKNGQLANDADAEIRK